MARGLCFFVTVTLTDTLLLLPSVVTAVTTQLPCATAVITPSSETVATSVSETLYCNVLLSALDGAILISIPATSPSLTVISVCSAVRALTRTFCFSVPGVSGTDGVVGVTGVAGTAAGATTFTFRFAFTVFPLVFTFTVMVVVPGLIPVTTPFLLTFATFLLEDFHFNLPGAFFGFFFAFKATFFPTSTVTVDLAILIFFNLEAALTFAGVSEVPKAEIVKTAVSATAILFVLLILRPPSQ